MKLAGPGSHSPPGFEPPRSAGVYFHDVGWCYQDPHGKQQDPFPASKMLQWQEQGYFPSSLQVQGKKFEFELMHPNAVKLAISLQVQKSSRA